MDSLLQAFGIATGFMLAMLCIKTEIVDAPQRVGMVKAFVELAAALVGTYGFCLVFQTPKRHIAIPTVGGLLSWGTYLFVQALGLNAFVSVLAAALIIGTYGEIFARIAKVPTTILYIPGCIPLIPGGNLYYSARAMITQDWNAFTDNVILLTLFAVGIAAGLAIVGEIDQMVRKFNQKRL